MTRYRSFPVSKNPLLFICTSDTDVGGTLGEKFPFENPLELGHKELWLNKCQLLLNIWCIVAFAEVSADHCGQKSSPNASETSSLQFLSCHFFIPHCVLVQRPVNPNPKRQAKTKEESVWNGSDSCEVLNRCQQWRTLSRFFTKIPTVNISCDAFTNETTGQSGIAEMNYWYWHLASIIGHWYFNCCVFSLTTIV